MEEKCCVCNSANDLNTYKSLLTNKDKTYCINCTINGIEPYEDLVNFGWEYNMFNKTYKEKVIIPTLYYYNKNIKQFNEDVQNNKKEN